MTFSNDDAEAGSSGAVLQLDNVAATILDAAPDGIIVCDREGTISYASAAMCSIAGYSQVDLIGTNIDLLVPSTSRVGHATRRHDFVYASRARPMGIGMELALARSDGSEVAIEIGLSPVTIGDDEFVVASVRDVTAQRELAHRIAETNRRERLLDDRERIARDLHDTVIQDLYAAGLRIAAGLKRLSDDALREHFSNVIDQLDVAIRSLRSVVFDLHLNTSSHDTITQALDRCVTEASGAIGFRPAYTATGPIDSLPPQLAEHLISVVREALSNVARHAQASTASVDVTCVDGMLGVRVADDGIGLLPSWEPGNGTTNREHRARLFGGITDLSPGPTGGAVMRWSVPIPSTR